MQNYTTFAKGFLDFMMMRELKMTESRGNSSESFINNISISLRDCKLFNVTDKIKNLLCLTKTPLKNEEVFLPFPIMFLDVSFTKEELKNVGINIGYEKIYGIIIQKGEFVMNKEQEEKYNKLVDFKRKTKDGFAVIGSGLRISIMSNPKGNDVWFDTFNKNANIEEEFKEWNFETKHLDDTDARTREFIHKFVLNFINFLNDPEVDYVECIANPKQNEKRIKRKKVPLPNNCPITVTGKLKIYLDSLQDRDFTYNYRFWVRGHFRTLRAERYGANRGKRLWVAPFCKGSGVLIEKDYEVKNENL